MLRNMDRLLADQVALQINGPPCDLHLEAYVCLQVQVTERAVYLKSHWICKWPAHAAKRTGSSPTQMDSKVRVAFEDGHKALEALRAEYP